MADENKKAWAPKVGQFCRLTEQDPKKRDVPPSVHLFLVTEVGSAVSAKTGKDGKVVTKEQEFKVSGGKTITRTIAVTEEVANYGGVIFSAQRQLTEPRRGVMADSLSPLEV